MDSIGPDEQSAVELRDGAVSVSYQRYDLVSRGDPVARHACAELHGARSKPLHYLLIEQPLQLAAMDGELRPLVAGQPPTPLRVNFSSVQPDERPFLSRDSHLGEFRFFDPELVQLTYGIGLQVDAHTQWTHIPHRFENDAVDSNLMECQGCRQPADAAAGDDYGLI
jgi:hypothetical protein